MFLFVFFPLMLAEREPLEPGVGVLSDWLPAPAGERSAGHVTPASRLTASTLLNKLKLLCRPLRGSHHEMEEKQTKKQSGGGGVLSRCVGFQSSHHRTSKRPFSAPG